LEREAGWQEGFSYLTIYKQRELQDVNEGVRVPMLYPALAKRSDRAM